MKLRDVSPSDLDFLYKLMNEQSVRAVSHNRQGFSYEEHVKYWQDKIEEPTFEAKIIETKHGAIGLIRRDRGCISIAILPEHRHKGIGNSALTIFCKQGDKAEIYIGNASSLSVFERVGFKIKYMVLEKDA